MTVTIKRIGGSVGVVIPKAVAREMGLAEGTALELSNSADEIVMRRRGRRPRRSMRRLLAQIDPKAYKRHNREFLSDRPVGKEIW